MQERIISRQKSESTQFDHARKILADDVELEIYLRTHFYSAEIGMLEGVGDDGHTETLSLTVADGETNLFQLSYSPLPPSRE